MIKLERGERPKELTDEVCEELKKLYAEDNDKYLAETYHKCYTLKK